LSIPILLIIVFQWLFPAGSPGLTVTLILGVIYVAVSVNTSISDILTGYAACNRKGDGNYEALIMLTVIILWLWMPLYGGATVIESLRRRP
jgi:hypothetical protein